jgi:hypothetical protein
VLKIAQLAAGFPELAMRLGILPRLPLNTPSLRSRHQAHNQIGREPMSLKPTPTMTECIEAWTVLLRACRELPQETRKRFMSYVFVSIMENETTPEAASLRRAASLVMRSIEGEQPHGR